MQESYREGVANHPGPKPCEGGGNVALEALDRGICRLAIELRNRVFRGKPTASDRTEGETVSLANARAAQPRGVEEPKHAEKLHTREPGGPEDVRAVWRTGRG